MYLCSQIPSSALETVHMSLWFVGSQAVSSTPWRLTSERETEPRGIWVQWPSEGTSSHVITAPKVSATRVFLNNGL